MSAVRVGFLGLGTVGGGALAALRQQATAIAARVGAPVVPRRAAVRDLSRARAAALDGVDLSTNTLAVATADDVEIVVECIGGVGIAREAVTAALKAGKSVVTANKELLAKHGAELFKLADDHGVDLAFEGAVAGGIPILGALRNSLCGNRIRQVVGIINGTTNYILSEMARTGESFAKLLADAQAAGYAESDPSADIDGHDAAYKLAILAMLAFDAAIDEQQVYRETISSVTPTDIALARSLGYCVKLLAIGRDTGDKLELRVHPTLVPVEHPLAAVNDVFNAVFVEGEPVGQVMFYGRGAGAGPTGSAVAGDVIEVARNLRRGGTRPHPLALGLPRQVAPMDEAVTSYYVRMAVSDRPGVLASIANVLGTNGVSIAQVLQTPLRGQAAGSAELVWITHRTPEAQMRRSLEAIRSLGVCQEICNTFRCFGVDG